MAREEERVAHFAKLGRLKLSSIEPDAEDLTLPQADPAFSDEHGKAASDDRLCKNKRSLP
jgi:hypothetical protein